MKKETTTPQPDSKEGLQDKSFKTLHVGLCSNDEDWQLINEEGEEILILKSYPLKENAEYIMSAVNNYQSLVDENKLLKEARNVLCQLVKDMADSNKELLDKLNELHHYTDHKVKSYNIKDSMYFSVINIMANGLHTKFNNAKNIKQ